MVHDMKDQGHIVDIWIHSPHSHAHLLEFWNKLLEVVEDSSKGLKKTLSKGAKELSKLNLNLTLNLNYNLKVMIHVMNDFKVFTSS